MEGGAKVNERPTPETDAMIAADQHHLEDDNFFPATVYWRMCDVARTLERERDEAREAAEKAKAYKRVLKDDNAKLRRELDEARDDARVLLREIFNLTQIGDPHPADLPMRALQAIAEMIDEQWKGQSK